MKRSRKKRAALTASVCASVIAGLAIGSQASAYSPYGLIPEPLQPGEAELWSRADVDRIVEVRYETIDGYEPVSQYGAPAACNKLSFLRFRVKGSSNDAEKADAALLMVPGILEGANGFDFIGRQLVYLAKTEYGRNIEVWAMDRRANCLEDLTGMQAAEKTLTVKEAENTLIGYYYQHQPINGKTFAGFLPSSELGYLYHFGIRQTTQDMFAIIRHMMPDADVRKRKVFVGGHSLGGLHTSAFLSWNLSGDPSRTEDAGYNWVAGAFGLETFVQPPGTFTIPLVQSMVPFLPPTSRSNSGSGISEQAYRRELRDLRTGRIARDAFFPGVIGPEVIAMPQALGLLADRAPGQESDVLSRLPQPLSPELSGILKIMHSRDLYNASHPPFIQDFRYTNQALMALFFDDNFSSLSFLQAGLGFLHGGPVAGKQKNLEAIAKAVPSLGSFIDGFYGSQPHYIATDAGPDLDHLGTGPLYSWARRDQIGSPSNPDYTDLSGTTTFTYLEKEPSDARDFALALHEGPTNLTEWYFPMRIVIDSAALAAPYAPKYGLDIDYPDGVLQVPSIVIDGSQGLTGHQVGDPPPFPQQQLIVAPGFHHLDPMFESVNSPSQNDYVMRPLLDFVLSHAS